ncbi:hypothetical protein TNCV_4402641 [Trichonephila clavipes]|uniref:Uncharacterized protein n=1 Tax=Trichonephila clavipes TaxID=2585209 RepID=A0A8X6S169_TRICX|nr:hypothetical protein TNCV_4402641 [Trichonephila clavipes]
MNTLTALQTWWNLPLERENDVPRYRDDNVLEDTITNDDPGSLEIHHMRCNEELKVQRKKKPKKEKTHIEVE